MVRGQILLPHLIEEETETQGRPSVSFKLSMWDRWGQKPGLQLWGKGSFHLSYL